MMEAKLLCLKKVGAPSADWYIANGNGLPVSQAQVLQAPPPLFTAARDKNHLIVCLTDLLKAIEFDAEPGWSSWQLHHVGEIESGYWEGQQQSIASAIIVRDRVTEGV
ncbi:hypothetical protein IMSHALPRED_006618 [Imshaugia aleurites]|uniref:Uncharacterized protein n=1 Tax=Imshaugia aleurites TaxID=172621 RepID=A0A8H3EK86_9LECA|nr:hypothetical protein IMSHALPRED_006618 [Imshaugia aleurites]